MDGDNIDVNFRSTQLVSAIPNWLSPDVRDNLIRDLEFVYLVFITELRILNNHSFLKHTSVRELTTSAWMLMGITYLDRHL